MAAPECRVVIVAGPPGAGKGTQCKRLVEKHKFVHVSTGDIFRDAVARGTELGVEVDHYIRCGQFVPDHIVIKLIQDKLNEPESIARGVLLDGFPRTAVQGQMLAEKVNVERFILIQVPDTICVDRVLQRRIDPDTGDIYSVNDMPADVAAKAIRREVAINEESVQKRLQTFHAQLGLILTHFGGKIQPVNGQRTIAEVNDAMDARLESEVPKAAAPAQNVNVEAPQPVTPKCTICMDQPADFLVIPCGHQCGCDACLTRIRNSTGRCPMCKTEIEGLVRVFQCGVLDGDEPAPVQMSQVEEEDGGWGDGSPTKQSTSVDDLSIAIEPCDDVGPEGGTTNVSISVKSPDSAERQPIDICCAVDISASMRALAQYEDTDGKMKDDGLSYLDIVKHAVKAVIHMLTHEDRFSLIAFDTIAETVFALSEMTKGGKDQAIEALETLQPRDRTNIWEGVKVSMDSLQGQATGSDRKKTVLLLTDGQPNISPPMGHKAALQDYLENHVGFSVQVNTFGFGNSLDSELLLDLATEGNGTYAFIPDAKIVGTAFVNSVANAASTRTQSSTLHLVPKNGAEFVGNGPGHLNVSNVSWGRVVNLGPLQYGQSREVVVPMSIPAGQEKYLEAIVVYPDSDGKDVRFVASSAGRRGSHDARGALARSEVVSATYDAIKACVENRGKDANQDMLAQAGKLASLETGASDERLTALKEDVDGRITKALTTKERFNRWGKHYLRALARAHQLQLCTNFMDPGLQVYGGPLFKDLKESGGKVFVDLPPPKPSATPVNTTYFGSSHSIGYQAARPTTTNINMQTYYAGAGGGCFGPSSSVVVVGSDGQMRKTLVSDVQAGDEVVVADGTAKVRCIVRIARRPDKKLVSLPSGLEITPKHPIRINGEWQLPRDVIGATAASVEAPWVWNFVLDRCHVLVVNNVECVTWGHMLVGHVVEHPLYGTQRIIEQLASLPGWNDGLVEICSCLRFRETREIAGFLTHQHVSISYLYKSELFDLHCGDAPSPLSVIPVC